MLMHGCVFTPRSDRYEKEQEDFYVVYARNNHYDAVTESGQTDYANPEELDRAEEELDAILEEDGIEIRAHDRDIQLLGLDDDDGQEVSEEERPEQSKCVCLLGGGGGCMWFVCTIACVCPNLFCKILSFSSNSAVVGFAGAAAPAGSAVETASGSADAEPPPRAAAALPAAASPSADGAKKVTKRKSKSAGILAKRMYVRNVKSSAVSPPASDLASSSSPSSPSFSALSGPAAAPISPAQKSRSRSQHAAPPVQPAASSRRGSSKAKKSAKVLPSPPSSSSFSSSSSANTGDPARPKAWKQPTFPGYKGLDATDNVPLPHGKRKSNFIDTSKQFPLKRKKKDVEVLPHLPDPLDEDAADVTHELSSADNFAEQFGVIPPLSNSSSVGLQEGRATGEGGNVQAIYDRLLAYPSWYHDVVSTANRMIGVFFYCRVLL
jgi:hypothetical protein